MKFLIEKEYSDDLEFKIVKDILDKTKYLHEYEIVNKDFFEYIDDFGNKKLKENIDEKYKDYVPIGRIPFVNNYYKTLFNIDTQNPIEIPKILRTYEFLKRNYKIVPATSLPRTGNYFIKDVSVLKNFTYSGNLEYFLFDEMFEENKEKFDNTLKINKNHLFQVSEVVNILSEWRIYIIDGKIVNISNYDGNTLLFPDINLINKANALYSLQDDYPKSYSFDVMITDKGTSITEVHTFSSLGLYHTLWGDELLYAFYDAKEYTLKHNTKIETFEVKEGAEKC